MFTATYVGDQRVEFQRAEPVEPGSDELQIRVAFVGLCGTDMHIIHGHMDQRVDMPLVFGHEMSGVVERVGAEVTGWSAGDPVTVMPLKWDGSCSACRSGNEHICHNLDFLGIDSPGALQSFWNVPAAAAVALPTGLPLDVAALVEPVAVAVHDVRRSELRDGDKVVALGGGPIGLLIAIVANECGAEVIVVEPDPGRRSRIDDLRIRTVDPTQADLPALVEEWTDGAGADVVFEVSGAAAAASGALALAKVRGTIVVVAIHPSPREMDLKRVFWRELRLLGARVYQRTDFEEAVRLLQSGVIPVEAIVTRRVALDRVGEAITELESGNALKILVDVQRIGDLP